MPDLVPVDFDPFVPADRQYDATITVRSKQPDLSPREKALEFFKSKGWSEPQAEGLVKRIGEESQFKTDAVNTEGGGEGARGIVQWRGPRINNFRMMFRKDPDQATFDEQLQFADWELNNTEKKAADKIRMATTADDAYKAATDNYFRPGPVSAPGGVRFSDYALGQYRNRPNTDLVSMSPDDYLGLSPPLDSPWQDRSGKSLLSSLNRGDPIEQIPTLSVAGGKVTDQDGRHRALAAQQDGLDSIPVAIKRAPNEQLPETIQGMSGNTVPNTFKPLQTEQPAASVTPGQAPASKGPLDWLAPGAQAAEQGATAQTQGQWVAARQGAAEPTLVPVEGNPFTSEQGGKKTPVGFDPTKQMTGWESFGSGLLDLPNQGAKLLTEALPAPVVQAGNAANNWLARNTGMVAELPPGGVPQQVAEREAAIQAQGGDNLARLGGQIVGSLPLGGIAKAVGVGARALPAVTGAIAGALQPSKTDAMSGLAWNTVLGAAGGQVGGSIGNALSRMIAPTLRPIAQRLASMGIPLTPGQRAGGMLQRAENSLASLNIVGSMIRSAERKSIEGFNNAALNKALEPIGESLPRDVPAGREAIAVAQQKASDAYDKLLSGVTFKADQELANDFQNLRTLVSEMPPAQGAQFQNIFRNRVMQRLQPTGTMDGDTFKQVESELTTLARPYKASQDAAQKQLGTALDEVKNSLRDALGRSNPGKAAELSAANRTYAMLSRVEDASMNRATADGVFTPADLLRSIRSDARRTGRRKAFARGDSMMQSFAEDAQGVLPQKVPDSGTLERATWTGVVGGSWVANPLIPAALAAISAPYTRAGMAISNRLVQQPRGPVQNFLAEIPRQAAQYGAPASGIEATRAAQYPGQ